MFNLTPEFLIAAGLVLLVALPFHEFSHALAAYRLGDGTSKLLGRLTLNPLAHIDPLGALLILVAGFGWAKPTPYNPYNLRGGHYGEAIVAAAGPLSNLVLAAAASIPYRFIVATNMDLPVQVFAILEFFVGINVLLMVFNLIPLPPLDGGRVAVSLLPLRQAMQFAKLEPYGLFILLGLMFTGVLGYILWPLISLFIGLIALATGLEPAQLVGLIQLVLS